MKVFSRIVLLGGLFCLFCSVLGADFLGGEAEVEVRVPPQAKLKDTPPPPTNGDALPHDAPEKPLIVKRNPAKGMKTKRVPKRKEVKPTKVQKRKYRVPEKAGPPESAKAFHTDRSEKAQPTPDTNDVSEMASKWFWKKKKCYTIHHHHYRWGRGYTGSWWNVMPASRVVAGKNAISTLFSGVNHSLMWELRNKNRAQGWGIGIRRNDNLKIAYGQLNTMSKGKEIIFIPPWHSNGELMINADIIYNAGMSGMKFHTREMAEMSFLEVDDEEGTTLFGDDLALPISAHPRHEKLQKNPEFETHEDAFAWDKYHVQRKARVAAAQGKAYPKHHHDGIDAHDGGDDPEEGLPDAGAHGKEYFAGTKKLPKAYRHLKRALEDHPIKKLMDSKITMLESKQSVRNEDGPVPEVPVNAVAKSTSGTGSGAGTKCCICHRHWWHINRSTAPWYHRFCKHGIWRYWSRRGSVSARIESLNGRTPRAVNIETNARNSGHGWGVGMNSRFSLDFSYGSLGTMNKLPAMSINPKSRTIIVNGPSHYYSDVFHKSFPVYGGTKKAHDDPGMERDVLMEVDEAFKDLDDPDVHRENLISDTKEKIAMIQEEMKIQSMYKISTVKWRNTQTPHAKAVHHTTVSIAGHRRKGAGAAGWKSWAKINKLKDKVNAKGGRSAVGGSQLQKSLPNSTKYLKEKFGGLSKNGRQHHGLRVNGKAVSDKSLANTNSASKTGCNRGTWVTRPAWWGRRWWIYNPTHVPGTLVYSHYGSVGARTQSGAGVAGFAMHMANRHWGWFLGSRGTSYTIGFAGWKAKHCHYAVAMQGHHNDVDFYRRVNLRQKLVISPHEGNYEPRRRDVEVGLATYPGTRCETGSKTFGRIFGGGDRIRGIRRAKVKIGFMRDYIRPPAVQVQIRKLDCVSSTNCRADAAVAKVLKNRVDVILHTWLYTWIRSVSITWTVCGQDSKEFHYNRLHLHRHSEWRHRLFYVFQENAALRASYLRGTGLYALQRGFKGHIRWVKHQMHALKKLRQQLEEEVKKQEVEFKRMQMETEMKMAELDDMKRRMEVLITTIGSGFRELVPQMYAVVSMQREGRKVIKDHHDLSKIIFNKSRKDMASAWKDNKIIRDEAKLVKKRMEDLAKWMEMSEEQRNKMKEKMASKAIQIKQCGKDVQCPKPESDETKPTRLMLLQDGQSTGHVVEIHSE